MVYKCPVDDVVSIALYLPHKGTFYLSGISSKRNTVKGKNLLVFIYNLCLYILKHFEVQYVWSILFVNHDFNNL